MADAVDRTHPRRPEFLRPPTLLWFRLGGRCVHLNPDTSRSPVEAAVDGKRNDAAQPWRVHPNPIGTINKIVP